MVKPRNEMKKATKNWMVSAYFQSNSCLEQEANTLEDLCSKANAQKYVARSNESPVEKKEDDEDGNEIDPNDADNNEDPYFVPMTDSLLLNHGPKPLTAISVDPAGSRVATGGLDFEVKLWDFSGMDKSCRAFKAFQPCEDHQIKNLEFSPSGK